MVTLTSGDLHPRILTNMAFWQSPEWLARTDSIYQLDPAGGDPAFMPWWKEALILYYRQSRYDMIHTMGVRTSFAYAFLCWITGKDARQVMTEVFIDAPRKESPAWRVKTWFYRKLARRALGIITNSSAEMETIARRFGLPGGRLRYVPLNTTIANPEAISCPDGHLFCAGRTLRDYPVLLAVMEATGQPWHVVAGQADLNGMALPAHVTLHRELDREHYLSLLRGARIVVLPLLPTERATGQVVLLEAMSYGKPVITSRAPGTMDIIRDGENGFLLEPGDANGIIRRLGELLDNPERCRQVGLQALEDIMTRHTVEIQTRQRLHALENFLAGGPA